MIFHVRMDVNIPKDIDQEKIKEILLKEKEYSQSLQSQGKWRHLWRITGEYSNISIFDVESNEELHNLLQALPLFPYMNIKVMPLNRHPSSIRDDDS
jgi:muconolactone D-isomerase